MLAQMNARHAALQEEVRAFIRAHAHRAPQGRSRPRRAPDVLAWQALLLEHGYAGREVPREYGGFGAAPDVLSRSIIGDEFARAGVPGELGGQGPDMVVPTLLAIGTEAHKRAYIAPTLRGEFIWCQGFSEPNAGSDLASLRTSAREDGEHLVLNGQKIWTSSAHQADYMHCLVRTGGGERKTDGLTYLIVKMDSPGIAVRRIPSMTGKDYFDDRPTFNEVFLTDVRVPRGNVIGEVGQGWAGATRTLSSERSMLGDAGRLERRLHDIGLLFAKEFAGRRPDSDPVLLDRMAALSCRVAAMRAHADRLLAAALRGDDCGLSAMVMKLLGCELNYQLSLLAVDAMADTGQLYEDSPGLYDEGVWPFRAMFDLALVIGGGSAQIQRNIISERGLGLPRERALAPSPPAAIAREGLTDDQEALAHGLARMLEQRAPIGITRAFSRADHASADGPAGDFQAFGGPGLLVPERFGGSGLSTVEAAVVAHAIGRACTPLPYLGALLASRALTMAGTPEQQDAWLASIAGGAARFAVSLRHGQAIAAAPDGVSGRVPLVADAPGCNVLLVADAGGRLHLVRPQPGLAFLELVTVDRSRRFAEVQLAAVAAQPLRGDALHLPSLLALERVLLAAETLGACESLLQRAVAYAGQRQQFGRPIGAFQAIKHLCADHAAELDLARSLVWHAAAAHAQERADAPLLAAKAKAHMDEVARGVARAAIEIHGAMGFADESDLHFWTKRVALNRSLGGPPEQARREIAAAQSQVV
ncbi:acyl-CoA dehydrogenase family protein [Ramlibacter sp. AN1015]|uniref:acyl-CoA dehydrogenase family protein n=1 Tax=Ramlibacter sp. AN1015 TaxID=3133428 RepID=UPI0030C10F0F